MVSYSASPREAAGARAAVDREHAARPRASAMRAMRSALRRSGAGPVRILSVTGTSTARDHGLEDARHQRLVLEQRRAGGDVADLLRRAAHVDVDDLRALRRRCSAPRRRASPGRRRRSAPRSGRPRRRGRGAAASCAMSRSSGARTPSRTPRAPAPKRRARRRKGRSVMPAIGATNNPLRRMCAPICISGFVGLANEGSEFYPLSSRKTAACVSRTSLFHGSAEAPKIMRRAKKRARRRKHVQRGRARRRARRARSGLAPMKRAGEQVA